MKKAFIIVASVVLLVALAGVGGYRLYERPHLSADFNRAIIAALDGNASEADVLTHLRESRLQVRTPGDTKVQEKFERAISHAQQASTIENQRFTNTMNTIGEICRRTNLTVGLNVSGEASPS